MTAIWCWSTLTGGWWSGWDSYKPAKGGRRMNAGALTTSPWGDSVAAIGDFILHEMTVELGENTTARLSSAAFPICCYSPFLSLCRTRRPADAMAASPTPKPSHSERWLEKPGSSESSVRVSRNPEMVTS